MVSFKEFLLMEALNGDNDIEKFLNDGKDNVKKIIQDYDSISRFSSTDRLSEKEKNEFLKYMIVYIGYNHLNRKFIETIKNDFSNNGLGFKGILNKNGLPTGDFNKKIINDYLEFDENKSNTEKLKSVKNTINSTDDFFNGLGLETTNEDDPEKDEETEEKPKPKNDEESEKPKDEEETEEKPKPKDGPIGADNISSAGMDLPVKELRDAIYSGKEGQVESVLNKWENQVVKKIQEVIDARKRQTDKEGKYLEEEQAMLWEGIIQKFKDSKGLKYNREKNVEGMYDKNNEQHDANYKAKIHEIVNQAKNKLGEICRGINDYDISKRDRKKKIDRATFIIDRLIDSSYRVITDVRKNSSALGADQKAKIEAGKQRDADDEAFKNSFRGKDFEERLDAKSKGYADAFKAIFNKAGQKAQTLEDIAEAEVVGAIRESKSVEDFLSAVYHKNVVSSENGSLGTMTIAQFLSKKGIVVPKEEEVKNNNRKDLRLSEKKPEILGFTAGYEGIKQYIDNYKYYRSGIISTIIKELKQVLNMPGDVNIKKQKLEEVKATYSKVQNGEIINILINNITALKELDSQQPQTNANDQNANSQNNKLTPEQEKQAKEIEEMSQQQQQNDGVAATVTTAKCDGLPIGARRYSRAIRRRMNYALNKYM